MLKRLIILSLFIVPVFAQDVPQIRQFQQADVVAEVGSLHLQVKQLTEYIGTLQARIRELQDENAKLKAK